MPVPVQSAPGSIGESRHVPEERWAADPAGPEVRRTGPSAGTTRTSASAGPTGPARTDTPFSRSHRAQLQDSGRVASDSGRESRSLALPGICRVWASSMRKRSVPPRSGRVRQLRLPPRRRFRKRPDSLADWRDRTRRSGASREEYLSLPLQFMRTGRSGVLFHVEHQVRDPQRRAGLLGRACFTWNTRYEIHRVERASSNDCSASEEWALCRDSHPPRIPIRCRTDLAEELVAKPIVEAHTGQRRKAEVGQARRWPT